MEFNYTPLRLGLFVALITAFWLLEGFTFPLIDDNGFHDSRRIAKAWRYCIALFIIGAVSVSIVDHYVGTLDRINLRLLYILLGATLMIGSYLWLTGLQQSASHIM